MTSRLDEVYQRTRDSGGLALNIFLTIGYPSLPESLDLARAALAGGADVLELGVPFSDPIAEGPTIQHSSQVALENGVNLADCLRFAAQLRSESDAGLILMGYANPFLAYGINALADDARAAGVDGFIVPDLPAEESASLSGELAERGLALVQFLAPTTDPDRAKQVVANGSGFIYVVSLTGVTGARQNMDVGLATFLRRTRLLTDRPLAVGFGISSSDHVRGLRGLADGVIVGSAFVKIAGHRDRIRRLAHAQEFVAELSQAAR